MSELWSLDALFNGCISKYCTEGLARLINNNPLIVGYIVNMIRLDYFDEAIGVIEGFSIFEDLMRCGKIIFSTLLCCELNTGR